VDPGLGKRLEKRVLVVRLGFADVDSRLAREALVDRLVVVSPPERQERSPP
jgi:hypothetical protein